MAKTHDKKKDFIDTLMSISDTELNDFIKRHGKKPKNVIIARLVDKKDHKIT